MPRLKPQTSTRFRLVDYGAYESFFSFRSPFYSWHRGLFFARVDSYTTINWSTLGSSSYFAATHSFSDWGVRALIKYFVFLSKDWNFVLYVLELLGNLKYKTCSAQRELSFEYHMTVIRQSFAKKSSGILFWEVVFHDDKSRLPWELNVYCSHKALESFPRGQGL